MGDPQGQLSRFIQAGQRLRFLPDGGDIGQLLPHLRDTAHRVPLRVREQGLQPLGGVVEIRDGLIQVRCREVGQLPLERAEGLSCPPQDLRVRAAAVCNGRDIVGEPPEAVLLVVDEGLPVVGVVEVQRHAGLLLRPDVLRNEVRVAHQLLRLAEGVGIHPLHDVVLGRAVRLAVCDLVGLVHIADLDLLISQVVAFDAECLADFFQLLIHIHENGPPSSLFRKRPGKSRYVSSASCPVCGVPATARRPPIIW